MPDKKFDDFEKKGKDLIEMALALTAELERPNRSPKPSTSLALARYEAIIALNSIINSLSLLFKQE